MRRWIATALLLGIGAVTLAGPALAGRDLKEFKPPHEMTPEELEASKRASRTNVNDYSNQVTEKVSPIPWKAIALAGAALLLAAPLALRYYRETAQSGPSAGGRKSRARSREEEPDEVDEAERDRREIEAREGSTRRLAAENIRAPSGKQAQMPDADGTRVPQRPPPRRPN
jgi:hypothetical protein